jgi:hypothetical protein
LLTKYGYMDLGRTRNLWINIFRGYRLVGLTNVDHIKKDLKLLAHRGIGRAVLQTDLVSIAFLATSDFTISYLIQLLTCFYFSDYINTK